MNIHANLKFDKSRPATCVIHKSPTLKYFAVGLLKGQILQKHKTDHPTVLTVIEGEIHFAIEGQIIRLQRLDTYEIPIGIEHEVQGCMSNNVFTLVQDWG